MTPVPDLRFDPYWWARQWGYVPYRPGVVTPVPGAGLDASRYIRGGGLVRAWPHPATQVQYQNYKDWPRRPRELMAVTKSVQVNGLGANALLDAARYEIQSDVERTVTDIFSRYVVPFVVGSALLSVFAFGLSITAYRRAHSRNPNGRPYRSVKKFRVLRPCSGCGTRDILDGDGFCSRCVAENARDEESPYVDAEWRGK